MEDMRSGEREARRKASRTLQSNAGLAVVDPWNLPRLFVMPKDQRTSSLRTHSGYWKEKEDEFIAIRSEGGGEASSSPSSSPCYQGVRRTLEFYERNGTKTDWVMHEYNDLDDDMFLREDVVIRKVFTRDREKNKQHTDEVPYYFKSFDRVLEECHERLANDDGESDGDVWQYFTRIKTKDPDVVYAACHCCDRVLRAPSNNGTSHLRRHRKTKACACHSNPSSTAEDQEILRELRANLNLYTQGKMEGRVVNSPELNASVDPWDLPTPRYCTSSLSWKTSQGFWKETKSNDKLIAIRIGQLPGSMVFRKLIQIFKDALKELETMWNGDNDEEERYIGEREEEVKAHMSTLLRDCLLGEVVQGDQSRVGKRKRTGGALEGGSEVWLYFTKIYTTDPNRVYAVCHSCDRGYKGHSKNGTSHLKRHNKTCSSKHRKRTGEGRMR
ncbi:uncharacterized protein C2845_PM05G03720 [Panicum miliaceum]|uniref:BED-type domain-containing protein n=1 Tax=Panicum miliaceum TaxID=4540 RepID=A0A3L6T2D0_PANMI|nr:uncharacterized protein C2845_PM05G03720 [Panicum miliaceum]